MGASHSTKNFEVLKTATNDANISWERIQKIRIFLAGKFGRMESARICLSLPGKSLAEKSEDLILP